MPTTPKRKIKKPSLVRIQKQVVNYIQAIENENEQLKNDPETTLGQVIPQLREAISQNKRLSVLAAALIEASGGSVTVAKELLESFELKVLSIKWAVPEGVEDASLAKEFVFTYEALIPEAVATPQIPIMDSDVEVESPDESKALETELTGE